MIEHVRTHRDTPGLVSTVSGILNKPGLAVYATSPGTTPLLVDNLAEQAERATARVGLIAGYRGTARVAAYTVTYDQMEPARTTIIADTPTGERCVATAADAVLARRVTNDELIGATVHVDGNRFEA